MNLENEETKTLMDFLKSTKVEDSGTCHVCGKEVISKHDVKQPFQRNTMVQYYSPLDKEHVIILNVHGIDEKQEEVWVKGCFDLGTRKRA